jgi:hypothetical protein
MNKWYVIQWGYAIFGQGSTPEEAVIDAKQWIDKDDPKQSWAVTDFQTNLHTAAIGEFVLCQWSKYIEYLAS